MFIDNICSLYCKTPGYVFLALPPFPTPYLFPEAPYIVWTVIPAMGVPVTKIFVLFCVFLFRVSLHLQKLFLLLLK